MWPFNKKYSLAESGILRGMTDYHCHILPGVDDGVRTLQESLELLKSYEQSGIQTVWLTPHIMEDVPNRTAYLKEVFQKFKSNYTGNITLNLSAENMLDNLFDERLSASDVFTIIDGRHILVETSYYNPPMGLYNILLRIQTKGFIPLLAHPERYVYMEQGDYESLKEKNVKFQLNLPSLAGVYGSYVQNKAKALLKNGFYDLLGTDTHSINAWVYMVNVKCLSKDTIAKIEILKS